MITSVRTGHRRLGALAASLGLVMAGFAAAQAQAPASAGVADAADLPLPTLVEVSATLSGSANSYAYSPAVSADGTTVAFSSEATNLSPSDQDTAADVYVRDLRTNVLTLASTTASGAKANGTSGAPSLSADGSKLAFVSVAGNLPGAVSGVAQVYVKDLASGSVTLASALPDGSPGLGSSRSPALSADGTVVSFVSEALNLGSPTAGGVYVKQLGTGTLTLASASASGAAANAAAVTADLSDDSTTVVFDTTATNLVGQDTDVASDVYVKNLVTGAVSLASVNASGVKGNGDSQTPSVSADGSRVAFATLATNLSPEATDTDSEFGRTVFVKDLATGALTLASGYYASQPAISGDGTKVAFVTPLPMLPGDVNGSEDAHVRDLVSGVLLRVSPRIDPLSVHDSVYFPALSASGGTVAFVDMSDRSAPPGDLGAYRQRIVANETPMVGAEDLPVLPLPDAAPGQPRYVSLLMGRNQWTVDRNCVPLSSALATNAGGVASFYDSVNPSYFGVGNAVVDYSTPPAGSNRTCGGNVEYSSFADMNTLKSVPYGWKFISASKTYTPFTELYFNRAQDESCGSLAEFNSRGFPEAKGLFAYPGGPPMHKDSTGAPVQSSQDIIVQHCFSYGRRYGTGANAITGSGRPNAVENPWFVRTNSITGGTAGAYRQADEYILMVRNLVGGEWLLLQPYRFVKGFQDGDHDCRTGVPHYTKYNEEYCWEDWQRIVRAIPAGVTVTDPLTVAQNWPGNRTNPS